MDINIEKQYTYGGITYKLQDEMNESDTIKNLFIVSDDYLNGKSKELSLKLNRDASLLATSSLSLLTYYEMGTNDMIPFLLAITLAAVSAKVSIDRVLAKIDAYDENYEKKNTMIALNNNLSNTIVEDANLSSLEKANLNAKSHLDFINGKKLSKKFKLCKNMNAVFGIISGVATILATVNVIMNGDISSYVLEGALLAFDYHFLQESLTDLETQKDLEAQSKVFQKISNQIR